jgi:predicted ATPase
MFILRECVALTRFLCGGEIADGYRRARKAQNHQKERLVCDGRSQLSREEDTWKLMMSREAAKCSTEASYASTAGGMGMCIIHGARERE